MIGIVVVSHSRALADAAVGLAAEMVAEPDRPVIAVAAGLDATTFGTDAMAVAEAITAADSPDGVLVLLDLGSAVLSAEMALEFVDPDLQTRVVLSGAPLVEGLVAAVVLASTGAPIDAVAAEAVRGLAAKQDHLGDAAATGEVATSGAAVPDRSVEVEVTNPHGLHARPAARLVTLVRSYDAQVTLTDLDTGRGPVDAGSLSLVATLNVQQGHRLRVGGSGPQAAEALEAVRQLAARAFDDVPATPAAPTGGAVPMNGAAPVERAAGSGLDVAVGPALVPAPDVDLSGYDAGDPPTELDRSAAAVAAVADALRGIRASAGVGAAEADIFDAQLALLTDPGLAGSAATAIDTGTPAPTAWRDTLDALADRFEGLDDAYQRERAQDVRSIRHRLLAELAGVPVEPVEGSGVLVVPEIDAATAATVDAAQVLGIATRGGGATGHGVIVARSRGIPIITDVGDVEVEPGRRVAFDARTREFVVDPDEADFRGRVARRTAEREDALRHAAEPAVTGDGCAVRVLANVGSVADARAAYAQGAEGAGLVRTEVLFGDRATAPSADEQAEEYLALADALGGRPLTIRTWDVGGDKPLAFLPQPVEANPFLGERGLRMFRRRPEILREQLTAICRVAARTPVQVMFPMVTTPAEVAWAREQLTAVGDVPAGLKVGAMIEVPAAAVRIGQVAAGLDFVSIGTNDLTQYTTAADRGNAAVAGLADGLDPAVLRLVADVAAGVPDGTGVAVCGDLASDPATAVLLVGLGVRELSAVAPQVPLVKARLRGTTLAAARSLATRALAASSAAEVRHLLS